MTSTDINCERNSEVTPFLDFPFRCVCVKHRPKTPSHGYDTSSSGCFEMITSVGCKPAQKNDFVSTPELVQQSKRFPFFSLLIIRRHMFVDHLENCNQELLIAISAYGKWWNFSNVSINKRQTRTSNPTHQRQETEFPNVTSKALWEQ